MIPIIRTAAAVAVATLCSTAPQASSAQSFPSRPARIIVPFPPGQAADTFARLAAERLSTTWGQTVIVENRAGGAGVIGAEAAARAKPDGYTALMGSAGPISINPHVFAKLPYDALKDFVPLAQIVALPLVIVAHPSLPVRSVRELVSLARARPGQVQYASARARHADGGQPDLGAALDPVREAACDRRNDPRTGTVRTGYTRDRRATAGL